ncbi:MAG TPA: tetratricopeptide repeat protein [Chloroflexota bacterium]
MVTAYPSAFGTLLKRYRIAAGLTQEELAERARLSVRAVSDLERGARRSPYRDTVQQLAEALALDDDQRLALGAAARGRADSAELPAGDLVAREPSAPLPPANLPSEPTSFIGREREIAAISALLTQPAARLITLTGPGGIGKTRLALHVAAHLLDSRASSGATRYPSTVFFVSLASISDSTSVSSAIAGVLDVQERGGLDLVHVLIERLRTRHLLLVLDNFEHLMEARSLLQKLLEACPPLHILVTSRTVLRLSWEHVIEVPPLALPGQSRQVISEAWSESEAVALFVERARAVKSDFTVTYENAEAVAQICRTLEGMPLALELAAARLRLFPPQALLGRLSQRFQVLTGGAHDHPARHQTLRAAIDWSYSLLDEEEKRLFARLSVFRGGCTLDAAEAVCNSAGDLRGEILDGVASLVEKSLLRQDSSRVPALGGDPRFVMLETIREYAAERLEESGASQELQDEHTGYFLALAEEAASALESLEQRGWLDGLEIERDNMRAAVQWTRQSGDIDRGLRLAVALSGFWMVRGPLSEGRQWLDELVVTDRGTPALRAEALFAAGKLAAADGLHQDAAELFEQTLALYRELDEKRGGAEATGRLVISWFLAGEAERVDDLLRQSEIQGRESGDKALLAVSLRLQAAIAVTQRDAQTASNLGEESLALYRELGDTKRIADVHQILARTAYAIGDGRRARVLIDEMLSLLHQADLDADTEEWLAFLAFSARGVGDYEYATHLAAELLVRAERMGNRRTAARARGVLGLLAREQGKYRQATTLFEESLAGSRQTEDLFGAGCALLSLSDVARDQGDAERVIELCEESLVLLREVGALVETGFAYHNLGLAAWYRGDPARAESLVAESLALFRKFGYVECVAEILLSAGLLALDQGQHGRAGEIFGECLMMHTKFRQHWSMGTLLENIAGVAIGQEHAERAGWLLGAAEAVRLAVGTPRWPALQSLYDRHLAATRSALGEELFLDALEQGRAMTLDQAMTQALDVVGMP